MTCTCLVHSLSHRFMCSCDVVQVADRTQTFLPGCRHNVQFRVKTVVRIIPSAPNAGHTLRCLFDFAIPGGSDFVLILFTGGQLIVFADDP